MAAKAIIRISALPDSKLRRALQGTVDAARKASDQTNRADVGSKRKAANEKRKISNKTLSLAQRNARAMRRESQKTANQQIRDAQKAQRASTKAAEKTASDQIKSAKKAQQGRRTLLAGAAGAALGAARGGAQLVGRGQQFAGVGTLESRLQVGKQLEEVLVRATEQARVGPERRQEIQDTILQASVETQTPVLDIAEGLQVAQERFSELEKFADLIPELAALAKASGSSMGDLVGTLGEFDKANKLTKEELRETITALAETSNEGAINVKQFARAMGPVIGLLQAKTGRTGGESAREQIALIQLMGTSGARPEEVGTMTKQFIEFASDPKVRERFAKSGVRITEGEGREAIRSGDFLPLREIIANLEGAKETLLAPGKLKDILGSQEVARAFTFAINAGAEKFAAVETAAGGQGQIDRTVALLTESAQGKIAKAGFDAQVKTIKDADSILKTITGPVKAMTDLQLEFPILTAAFGTLTSTIGGLIAAIAAQKFLGGGGGGGVPLGLGKLAGIGGGVVGGTAGASALAATGATVAGTLAVGAAAGAAAFLGTDALLDIGDEAGRKLFEGLGAGFAGLFEDDEGVARTGLRGTGIPASALPANAAGGPTEVTLNQDTPLKTENKATLEIKLKGPLAVGAVTADPDTDVNVDQGLAGAES